MFSVALIFIFTEERFLDIFKQWKSGCNEHGRRFIDCPTIQGFHLQWWSLALPDCQKRWKRV